jgi:glutamate dehydrogenase/leucine dehydrogenase
MPTVTIQKLTATDGFIAFDLDDAPAVGVTRSAPKILADGATLLARSLTYRFASFEHRIGGASAGVNAAPELRAEALAAFCAEVEPLVRDGRFLTEAAKGVTVDDLAPLRAHDPRPPEYWSRHDELTALGVAVAAEAGAGGLAGRRVAIEGFDTWGPALAAAVVERGGTVVAVGTTAGTAADAAGFAPDTLAQAWAATGADLVAGLTSEPGRPGDVLGADADILVAASKAGIVDHTAAARVRATAVVPAAAVPVTAKGLAVLRRAGVVVLPDFVTTAGPLFAGWPGAGAIDPAAAAADAITAVLAEVGGHEQGPLLGACLRAEAFLGSWRPSLPFGRPLA